MLLYILNVPLAEKSNSSFGITLLVAHLAIGRSGARSRLGLALEILHQHYLLRYSEIKSHLCYHSERIICREEKCHRRLDSLRHNSKKLDFPPDQEKAVTVWEHPILPQVRVTIAGQDGDDAKRYLVEEVQNALDRLKGKQ